jgi:hypothetical protein
MRGEVLASLAGAAVGYFAGIKENLGAQYQVFLNNKLTNTELFFYNRPAENVIANVIMLAIIFGSGYYVAKNAAQIINDHYSLDRQK